MLSSNNSELGTVIRSLGCCPSEADLNDLLLECEEEDSSGESFFCFLEIERRKQTRGRTLPWHNCLHAARALHAPGNYARHTGYIKYERFEPMMTKVLLAHRFKSSTEDEILRAFQVRLSTSTSTACRLASTQARTPTQVGRFVLTHSWTRVATTACLYMLFVFKCTKFVESSRAV